MKAYLKFFFSLVLSITCVLNPLSLASESTASCSGLVASGAEDLTVSEREGLERFLLSFADRPTAISKLSTSSWAEQNQTVVDDWSSALELSAQFLSEHKGPSLHERQNEALAAQIRLRTPQIQSSQNAQKDFQQVSQSNLARVFSPSSIPDNMPEAAAQEIDQTVSQLDVFFVHNSVNRSYSTQLPVFSAGALDHLGFSQGLNTLRFNRDLLETADMVFFFVRFKAQDSPNTAFRSQYGDTAIFLTKGYAQERGVVSPFIMQPEELIRFIQDRKPELAQTLKLFSGGLNGHAAEWSQVDPEVKQQVMQELGRLDFTVDDFLTWIREELRAHFVHVFHEKGEETLRQELNELRSQKDWTDFIKVHLLDPLGFAHSPSSLELKIPVAVPPHQYRLETKPMPRRFSHPGRRPGDDFSPDSLGLPTF